MYSLLFQVSKILHIVIFKHIFQQLIKYLLHHLSKLLKSRLPCQLFQQYQQYIRLWFEADNQFLKYKAISSSVETQSYYSLQILNSQLVKNHFPRLGLNQAQQKYQNAYCKLEGKDYQNDYKLIPLQINLQISLNLQQFKLIKLLPIPTCSKLIFISAFHNFKLQTQMYVVLKYADLSAFYPLNINIQSRVFSPEFQRVNSNMQLKVKQFRIRITQSYSLYKGVQDQISFFTYQPLNQSIKSSIKCFKFYTFIIRMTTSTLLDQNSKLILRSSQLTPNRLLTQHIPTHPVKRTSEKSKITRFHYQHLTILSTIPCFTSLILSVFLFKFLIYLIYELLAIFASISIYLLSVM
ncbi:unnamed protein product [Paramecium octaurelia]|uniref:Transmembrane protein n=1 Tax=Paramecium octaurelia TaxID=43137 RepID=A0A8S1YKI5_PAROT|nr:unnamed protein product [Paramecium octaurelia]